MKVSLSRSASFILILILCVVISSCNGKLNPQPAQQSKAKAAEAPLPPPTLDDVRAKVDSIYHGALSVDLRRNPVFLLGDFNADSSQDVLVAVRPNPARLADLNSDVAAWIVEDPRQIWVPNPNKRVQKMPPVNRQPVRVSAGDNLWAIIHGFRAHGWRNPIATQTYLLVNVTANGLRKESVHAASAEMKHNLLPVGIQYLLRSNGDVLRETVAGESYVLYWTGGHYARAKTAPEKPLPQLPAHTRVASKIGM
ncbi:MAG TPA: hypothetical protein VFP59_01710 [Candidatus Angelobacter sp.]|nr:hypothetical protein [Candidatus Angelobacter sp.]